jgi:putative transposase
MKRRRPAAVLARDQVLLAEVLAIKNDHPFWGFRRVWSYLKFRQGLVLNKKRIYRLVKENSLLVTKIFKLKPKRCSTRFKPRAFHPNQFWGIDMTKIKMAGWGWIYFTIVLDWYTKEIVGASASIQSKTQDWLRALYQAVNSRFPQGIRDSDADLMLISDNGCQPTSQRFMQECSTLGIKQIFTTWSNPKGNSDTERVMRTIKEDLVWSYEWDNPFDFEIALRQWINSYNNDFPHQALGNRTPAQHYQDSISQGLKNQDQSLTSFALA